MRIKSTLCLTWFKLCAFQEFKAMQNGSKRSKSCSDESTRNKVVCFGYDQQYWEHQAKEDARVILKSEKVSSHTVSIYFYCPENP